MTFGPAFSAYSAAALAASHMAGAAVPDATTQLSSRDRALVTAAACAATGRDSGQLQATRPQENSPAIDVAVRCKPHRTEESWPVAHVTACNNRKGSWQCDTGHDALMVKLGESQAVALIPGAVPTRTALYLVTEAAKLTVPPFHRAAQTWLQDQCTVAQARDAAFKGGTHFDLKCTPGTLIVTRDCWKDRCRFFITGSSE